MVVPTVCAVREDRGQLPVCALPERDETNPAPGRIPVGNPAVQDTQQPQN